MQLYKPDTRIPTVIEALIDEFENLIVIKDGELITNTTGEDRLIITTKAPRAFLKDHFTSDKPVISANQESHTGALHLEVAEGIRLTAPINIVYIHEKKDLVQNTTLTLKKGAFATLNEYLYSESEGTINYLFQARLEQAASLEYSGIVNLDEDTLSTVNRLFKLDATSNVSVKTAQLGNGKTYQDTDIDLVGVHAYGEVKTVALSSGNQEVIINSRINHKARQTEGLIDHYGVANDESFMAFEGTGKIEKGMAKSIAHQHNKGVILGETARLDANPLLLIDEFDVDASHGAAIGKIDEEQLYYLMSRGLSEKDAQRLIINGFLLPLESLMQNEKMKDHINALLEAKTR